MRKPLVATLLALLLQLAAQGQANFQDRLADSAFTLTKQHVRYDPAYFRIGYPNGDVPADRGVCTDVVIRAYRKLGIDLQQEVHEDMKARFAEYPKQWGLTKPDSNIDHRRVPNLMTFFSRHGSVKPITTDAQDYLPGDTVTRWEAQHDRTQHRRRPGAGGLPVRLQDHRTLPVRAVIIAPQPYPPIGGHTTTGSRGATPTHALPPSCCYYHAGLMPARSKSTGSGASGKGAGASPGTCSITSVRHPAE